MSESRQDYRTGRFVARLVAGLGWLVVGLGVLVMVVTPIAGQGQLRGVPYGATSILLAALGGGLLIVLFGLAFVVIGQSARARMDTAEYSRQLLELARTQPQGAAGRSVVTPSGPLPPARTASVPTVVESIEHAGWRIERLSNGIFAINTTEGWRYFASLDEAKSFIR